MENRPFLQGVGKEYVDFFEPFWRQAWVDHFSRRHGSPARIAFMTICSHAKPYSKSFIHASLRRELAQWGVLPYLDYIHISNAGIIPETAEEDYPFCAYDWDINQADEETMQYHIASISRRLTEWYHQYAQRYEKIIVYLRSPGHTWSGVRQAKLENLPVPIRMVPAVLPMPEKPSLRFRRLADRDDCLVLHRPNLIRLQDTFGGPI